MYKLILFIMLCMWSVDSDTDRKCMQQDAQPQQEQQPDVLAFLNPFQFSN